MSNTTTILPAAPWRTRPGLAELVAALGGGANVRFVGGAVRDTLLALPVSDVDMATRLAPADVIARLDAAGIKAIPTGLPHGTVTAVSQGLVVEVTTLRRDVTTDGRHARVAFTDDWREDALRRDFTINALYADPETGAVFDSVGGIGDLNAGSVRFIGDPLERIAEDHLRILRFFRFHARFGRGAPEPAAYAACAARANDLMALSRERIADELLKLLGCTTPVDAIRLMLARDILKPVLPEIESVAALDRLVARERAFGVASDPVRRLAALIDDGPATGERIAARLRLSKAKTKRLVAGLTPADVMSGPALAYRRGAEGAVDALLLGHGTAAEIAALSGWARPALALSGGDLIARGLAPGPVIARTLAVIEREWVEAGFPEGETFNRIVKRALSAATS